MTSAATDAAGPSWLANAGVTKEPLGAADLFEAGVGTPNARSPGTPGSPGTPRTPSEDGEGPRLRQRFGPMGAALGRIGGGRDQQLCRNHWLPDKEASGCMDDSCGVPFTLLNRRHHCRCCGDIFCNRCVSVRLMLDARTAVPTARVEHGVEGRVCHQCYTRAIRGQASVAAEMRDVDLVPTHTVATSPLFKPFNDDDDDDDDAQLSNPSTPNAQLCTSPKIGIASETAALLAATPTTPEQMRTCGADELRGLVARYNRALKDQARLTEEAHSAAEASERSRRAVEDELSLARAQVKRMGALWEELTNARRELEHTRGGKQGSSQSAPRNGAMDRTLNAGSGARERKESGGMLAALACRGPDETSGSTWSTRIVWHDVDGDGCADGTGGLVIADPSLGTVTKVSHADTAAAEPVFDEATGHSGFIVTYRDQSGWDRRLECRVDGVVAANRWARELDQRVREHEARGPSR